MPARTVFQKNLREGTVPENFDRKPAVPISASTRQRARNLVGRNITAPDDNDLQKAGRDAQEKASLTSSVNERGTAVGEAPKDLGSFQVEPIEGFGGGIVDNALNRYINVQYHLVLSMVPLPEVRKAQERLALSSTGAKNNIAFDDIARSIRASQLVTIASTGDVFDIDEVTFEEELPIPAFTPDPIVARRFLSRDVSGRNYFNIKSLTFQNYTSPTPSNPYVAQMVDMKMTLVEPHGLSFHEEITELSKQLGYEDIGIGRAVYRLDIFFSGYDPDTGEWVPQIKLDARTRKINQVSYFVIITQLQAKVDHTGTTYDLDLMPVGTFGWRPEEAALEANSVFTGNESPATQGKETFGGFLDQLEILMSNAKEQRTHKQIKRKYKFFAPQLLRQQEFYSRDFFARHNFLKEQDKGGSVVVIGRDIDVMSLVEAALQDIEKVWDEFLKEEVDPQFVEPRIHWNIRFNVLYDGRPNREIHDFDEMTLEYIIEPFATYKKAHYETREQVEQITSPEAQTNRIARMAELGMIDRVYDYIHTSENTEVIDFDLSLKYFYYRALAVASDSDADIGSMVPQSAGSTGTQRENQEKLFSITNPDQEIEAGTGNPSRIRNKPVVDSTLQRIFGRGVDRPPPGCQANRRRKSGYDTITGGFNDAGISDYHSSIGSQAERKRSKFQLNLNDYLRNDLIRIEDLQVRGDPIWLLSPYANESLTLVRSPALTDEDRSRNIGGGSIVRTQLSRYIFLRMFAPVQDDLMNPNRNVASTACSIIGGFYEVVTVQSTFEGGKFTQKITANVADHLNFAENFAVARSRAEEDEAEEETPQTQMPTSSEGTTPQEPEPAISEFFAGG